jgi:1,4-dihydroxy-2-naphthoyl-CoA hydrolase
MLTNSLTGSKNVLKGSKKNDNIQGEYFTEQIFYKKLINEVAMFEITRKIRMSETDATGAIYFTNQLKFATELFEYFLETKKLFEGEYFIPIVEARSRFFAPLYLGDEILLTLYFDSIQESSFVACANILKKGVKVGETSIKHVFISKEGRKRVLIPEPFRSILHEHCLVV